MAAERGSTIERISLYAGGVGSLLFLLTAILIISEIFMRFVLKSPTSWITETVGLFVIVAVFLSLALCVREKSLVKVDFFTAKMSGRPLFILELTISILSCLFCAILLWQGVEMVHRSYLMGDTSMQLQIPLWIPYSSLPIGAFFLTLQFIYTLKNTLFQEAEAFRGSATSFADFLPAAIFIVLFVLSIVLLKKSTGLGLFILFFVLLFSGIPVAFSLGLFGAIGLFINHGGVSSLIHVAITSYSTLDSIVMVALPLFIFNSTILQQGEVGPRIFRFVNTLVRHLPGGLGIATILFCGLFAAMTGSSMVVAAAVSVIALPEMLSRGYNKLLTIGLLAAGGTLGILFPPSLPLIIYAGMTMDSLGSLFLAGIIPGLILMAMFICYMVIVAMRDDRIQRTSRASGPEIWEAFKGAWAGLMVIVIIMGGIYSGIFTPTEAAGVAVVYGLLICGFYYRTLSIAKLKRAALDATRITAMMLFIVIGANITSQLVAMSQIPNKILELIAALNLAPWMIILAINIFLVIMGATLEAISILVVGLPILYPLVTKMGFSGVWFAIIMMINMELALISPPEGLNLFVLQNLSKASTAEVSRAVIPFLFIIGGLLALISCLPALALYLPSLLVK